MNSFQTFSKDIAKYFMDFLETNFKGQKIPKRSIRPTNVAGQSINVNLKKYENIIPCGIKNKGITNLKKIKNQDYTKLEKILIDNFIFNLKN